MWLFCLFVSLFKHSVELTQTLITSCSRKDFGMFLVASNIYKSSRKCKLDFQLYSFLVKVDCK